VRETGLNRQRSLTIYRGRAGDRNERGMAGAVKLGTEIARRCGTTVNMIGTAGSVIVGGWRTQLLRAHSDLWMLAEDLSERLDAGEPAITIVGRCTAGIATLPVVARRHPDATIVWVDAHGDSNTPKDLAYSESAYLGGMVLTGAAGEWDTGLGADLDITNVVLVGSRDLDPPEWDRIRVGQLRLVEAGDLIAERLLAELDGNPVYIHLDCDVLEAGLLPTEYQVPNGLSYENLMEVCMALSQIKLVGIEIAEFEATWPDGNPGNPNQLIDAVFPVLQALIESPGF
jgi:arginase